ncbi:beta-lactamase class A [Anseongella ginsenosidimutans]|uniref:Beta-lactamase n=1 Tax=Anseongella ginsenosidimutans TaxID=496056 RepID=A0A4R3KL40_9SPHI|nr:class A beta-lactamase [Anseongella ginsenosidimutans]QEC53581.1 class A beta-lactamase [Anseongella ginsenosidimutans]TCS84651.1 beta-lactamase class A [Anseongella ginsenosidimutans]
MKQRTRILFSIVISLALLLQAVPSAGQATLESQISHIAKEVNGRVGVCALVLETGEAVSYNGGERYPMQSVYKFPIAMAVLEKVDRGELTLDQQVRIDTTEYIPENGHSPLRDKFPGGTSLTVRQLLHYNTAESDGTACDVLLRLLGGTKKAQRYVRRLGIKNMAIATTEQIQVANDLIQYRNWSTPKAMTELFRIFYQDKPLSEESTALLMEHLSPSGVWFNRRIKGLLPPGTPVVHKTGTAGTIDGLTRATNDAGIITLPNGNHVAITIFLADSHAVQKDREATIAKIARAVFDQYAESE